jgi:superfamily II DNA/RNA helicase
MTPEDRDRVMEGFRQRTMGHVLITTTNVLDAPWVNLVVNYDPPATTEYPKTGDLSEDLDNCNADCEGYFHRVSRLSAGRFEGYEGTGRFGRKGVAISFENDATDKFIYDTIESHFDFTLIDAPSDDLEAFTELIEAALGE